MSVGVSIWRHFSSICILTVNIRVSWPSYLYDENPCTWKKKSLHCNRPFILVVLWLLLLVHEDLKKKKKKNPKWRQSFSMYSITRDNFVYAPSQWEMTLQCNVGSHWLGTYIKCSLHHTDVTWVLRQLKLPATLLFAQQLVQANNKENIKRSSRRSVSGDRCISLTKGQKFRKHFHIMTSSSDWASQSPHKTSAIDAFLEAIHHTSKLFLGKISFAKYCQIMFSLFDYENPNLLCIYISAEFRNYFSWRMSNSIYIVSDQKLTTGARGFSVTDKITSNALIENTKHSVCLKMACLFSSFHRF